MRLTQGALGMLLKRYKLILRKCQILNILGGAALAASLCLASGSALAADPDWSTDPVVIDSQASVTSSLEVPNLTIAQGGDLNVNIPNEAGGRFYLPGQLILEDGGKLTVEGRGIAGIPGDVAEDDYSFTGSFTMNGGTLDILDSRLRTLAIDILGGTVNVYIPDGHTLPTTWNYGSRLFGSPGTVFTVSGSNTEINIGNYGLVRGSQFAINNGATINMGADSAKGAAIIRSASQVFLNDGVINVLPGKYGDILTEQLAIGENGTVNVDGTLAYSGHLDGNPTGTIDVDIMASTDFGSLYINGGKVNIGAGGNLEIISSHLHIQNNGSLHNAGTLTSKGNDYQDSCNIDLSTGNYTAAAGSVLEAEYGRITLTGEQLNSEALKGGVALNGGALYVTGANVAIAADKIGAAEVADGKIAFTGSLKDYQYSSEVYADDLHIQGPQISLANDGSIAATVLRLDQDATLTSGYLGITGMTADSRLVAGDGAGTLTLKTGQDQDFASLRLESALWMANQDKLDITGTIDANVVLEQGSAITIEGRSTSSGIPNHTWTFNRNVSLNGAYTGIQVGTNSHIILNGSESLEAPNTLALAGDNADVNLQRRSSLTATAANTAIKATQGTRISVAEGASLNAGAQTLGLAAASDGNTLKWSSANINSNILGNGDINISGMAAVLGDSGAQFDRESFNSLKQTLLAPSGQYNDGQVYGGIVTVDADIAGAVVDGRASLADVTPGTGLLAGANLGTAIVQGEGAAGDANAINGGFGGVELTNQAATGITVVMGTAAALRGQAGSQLVTTPAGAGNVKVEAGAYATLDNGSIGNLENAGSVSSNNVAASRITLQDNGDMYVTGTLDAYSIEAAGDGEANGNGVLEIENGARVSVTDNIGTADKPLDTVRMYTAELNANNLSTVNLEAYGGAINISGELNAENLSSGANITTGTDLQVTNINLSGGSLTAGNGSIIANSLSLQNSAAVTAPQDVIINGQVNVENGQVNAQAGKIAFTDAANPASISGNASLSASTDVLLAGGADFSGNVTVTAANGNIDATGKNLRMNGAGLTLSAPNGSISAADIQATNVAAKSLDATGQVSIANGTANLTEASRIQGGMDLEKTQASIGDLAVAGETAISGGAITSSGAVTLGDNAQVVNGAEASFNELTLVEGKALNVGSQGDGEGGTSLTSATLRLSGADLLVDPAWGLASTNVAVKGFNNTGAAATDSIIDGNVVVGQNSFVTFGTTDRQWLPGVLAREMGIQSLSANGVSAALGLFAPMTLGNGHSLTVDGQWQNGATYSRNNHAITFANNSLLVVNGKPAEGGIAYEADQQIPAGFRAALSAQQPTTATVAANARVHITGAEVGKNYVILDPETISTTYANDTTAWAGDNLSTDNPLVALQRADLLGGKAGALTSELRPASITLPNLDGELANVLNNAALANEIGITEEYAATGARGTQFLSRALIMASPDYGNDPAGAEMTIEGAARMAVVGAVPQMALAANNAAGAAVTQRTSLADPGSAIQGVDENGNTRSGQDLNKKGLALWIMPLFQSTNGFGMEAGNFDYDFSGSLGGVALGADYTFENSLRAGLLFNIGGGYARGGGDFNTVANNMNFWGIGAYAGFNMNNFGLTADVNYTSTYNKLKQDLYGMGNMDELKSDITAWALSAGLRAEYKINTEALDIIPHIGARFISLNTDSYDITSHGNVINGDSFTQNIWTFPIGVNLSREFKLDNGWSIKPLVDLNIAPMAGDVKAKSKIQFTGTGTEAELDTKMMDYFTYGGTAGIEFGNGNFSVGVNYNGQFGAESSAHGVFGTFRYEF